MSNYNYTNTIPYGACYIDTENRYYSNPDYVVGCQKNRLSFSSQECSTEHYRMIFKPPMNLPSDILLTDTIISSAKMVIQFTPEQTTADGIYTVGIYQLKSTLTGNESYEERYNIASSGVKIQDIDLPTSGTTVTITDTSTILNVLRYGISFAGYNYPNQTFVSGHNIHYYTHKIKISYDITYQSKLTAPIINIINNTFIKSVTDSVQVSWNYSQELNSPQSYIDLELIDSDGVNIIKLLDKYPSSAHTYTITSENLIKIKQSGEIMKIKICVYSAENIASNYVVAKCNLIYPTAVDLTPKESEIKLLTDIIDLKWDITAVYNDIEYEIQNYPDHFDIDYSVNGGESWNAIIKNQMVQRNNNIYKYNVSEGILPLGIILWRIQAYVNGYSINQYSIETFITKVQASTSSITCDGKPIPTLSWQSSAQVAYQVRFSDYDSGAIYGTETSYTVPYFYADGKYPVQVRTQASNGEWSKWTEIEYVTITNETLENQIGLTVNPTRHAVLAKWTDSGESDNYILYRNGIPVYVGKNKSYTDIAANGRCTYFVRAVTGKYYAPSNSVIIEAYPRVDCLYDFGRGTWIPLKYSLSPRSRSYSKNVNIVYNYYAGRPKPVAFTSGYSSRQMSGGYVLKDREEASKISDLSGKRVIFKDTRGGIIVGILNSVNINVESKLYPVTFTITETDYNEAVEYAAT